MHCFFLFRLLKKRLRKGNLGGHNRYYFYRYRFFYRKFITFFDEVIYEISFTSSNTYKPRYEFTAGERTQKLNSISNPNYNIFYRICACYLIIMWYDEWNCNQNDRYDYPQIFRQLRIQKNETLFSYISRHSILNHWRKYYVGFLFADERRWNYESYVLFLFCFVLVEV